MLKKYILFIAIILGACATDSPLQHANYIAQAAGLTQERIQAGQFDLNTYSRINDVTKPIHIYIEGDGLAWINKNEISTDPTPYVALALQLASVDFADNVVYIARPCQFHDFSLASCDSAYWTNKRFSEEVIVSMNQAVDYFSNKTNHQAIHFIGYSGGAAIAVLLAARRTDVASIRTVAGNLNHDLLNKSHGVSAMPESLNPADFATQIKDIPQLHFIGVRDKVVPKTSIDSFIERQHGDCAVSFQVQEADHQAEWLKQWPDLLKQSFGCNAFNRSSLSRVI